MSNTQRVDYLDKYRTKLHKELDQMQYGRVEGELPPTAATPGGSSARLWAAAATLLVATGLAISQVL